MALAGVSLLTLLPPCARFRRVGGCSRTWQPQRWELSIRQHWGRFSASGANTWLNARQSLPPS